MIVFDHIGTRENYGQTGIDQAVPVNAIGRMLEHYSTKTEEKYYFGTSNDTAIT